MDEFELAGLLNSLSKAHDTLVLGEKSEKRMRKVIKDLEKYGRKINSCVFTQSHTRQWCGHPLCRES